MARISDEEIERLGAMWRWRGAEMEPGDCSPALTRAYQVRMGRTRRVGIGRSTLAVIRFAPSIRTAWTGLT